MATQYDKNADPSGTSAETSETLRRRTTTLISILAVIIIAAAAWVRFADLETNPPGLWQDEASTGLDAYLIWTTGSDRAGEYLPIISKSFGDYPLAGYRYLTAPIVGIFGLSIHNQRIIAALCGLLMVLLCGFVVKRKASTGLAFFTLVSAAVCPTWIHFSRYGSEAILLPFFLVLGFTLFELGEKRARYLWLGAISLAASAYTYHAVKLVLPLWMIAFLIYKKPLIQKLWRDKKIHIFGPALLFALLVVPSVWMALTNEGMARGKTVLAWQHYSGWKMIRVVLNNYLSYIDLGLLFVRGGPAVAQSIPGLGLWNLIELPFVLLGIYRVFQPSTHRRFNLFILAWFLLGPLPGGVTYETENIGRVIAWLPAPQILSGLGMMSLYERWQSYRKNDSHGSKAWRKPVTALFAGLFVIGWIGTYSQVFYLTLTRYPQTTQRDWQFEISRALQCAKSNRVDEQIVVAPNFQAVHTFAHFHLYDVKTKDGTDKRAWRIAKRRKVKQKELYVTPAKGRLPIGEKVCTIKLQSRPLAYVYRAKEQVDEPLEPKAKKIKSKSTTIKTRPFPQLPVRAKGLGQVPPIQGPKPQHR